MRKIVLMCIFVCFCLGATCLQLPTIDLEKFDEVLTQAIEAKATACFVEVKMKGLIGFEALDAWDECMSDYKDLVRTLERTVSGNLKPSDVRNLIEQAEDLGLEVPQVER